jgi:class 3 adenylate cyclase
MPAAAVEQRRDGDERAARRFADVSVLVADFAGLDGLGSPQRAADDPQQDVAGHDRRAMEQMADLVAACDEAAERSGVEKIRAVGGKYLAVCGLSVHRPDHAGRAVLFARELVQTVAAFNRQHGTSLSVSIGVNSGPVVGGVIGRQKFRYDLWGDTLAVASRLAADGGDSGPRRQESCISVTKPVHDRLSDVYAFTGPADIPFVGREPVKAWQLEG